MDPVFELCLQSYIRCTIPLTTAIIEEIRRQVRAKRLMLDRAPNRTPIQTGLQWLQRWIERPLDFYDEYRMSVPCFMDLHRTLVESYGLKGSDMMKTEEALAIFLTLCGHMETQRRLGRVFEHSISTINTWYRLVLESLCRLAADVVQPKDRSFAEVSSYLESHPEFRDAIGAIDGTHIPAIPPEEIREHYIGKECIPTQNVLVACDFDMRFTHVYAGTPGSQHDASVLRFCMADPDLTVPVPPPGKYYLVDSGYGNAVGFLAPYRNVTYHHTAFTSRPRGIKERFNYVHAKLRNIIERTIGVLKNKWPVLKFMREYDMLIQIKLVVACVALHNFIRDHDAGDSDICCARREGYTRNDIREEIPDLNQEPPMDELDMGVIRDVIAARIQCRSTG